MNTKEKLVNETLKFIAQKSWANNEHEFFDSLSLFLADKLQVAYVMINKLNPDGQTTETLSFVYGGDVKPNISYPLTNTPCENVMGKSLCSYVKNIQKLFPKDSMLVDMLAESYIGIPLWDIKGAPVGLIALLDTKPIENPEEIKTILQIVAVRVAHEIERNNYEHELIDKNKKAEESAQELKAINKELLKAKVKAEESELQLNLIADNFVNGMLYQAAVLDENTRQFTYVSKVAQELYGATPEEIMQDSSIIYSRVHPDDIGNLIAKEKEAIQNMSVFEAETRMIKADGSIRWAYLISKPRIIDGVMCFDGIELDITKRKQLEFELITAKEKAEESENKFKAAFYTSPDSVSMSTLNGKYVEINEGFTRISGYTETEVLGKTASEINIWAVPEVRNTFVETLRKNDYIENFESLFRTKNGTIIPALLSARIIMIKNEPFILAVARDITDRKKYEAELIKAKEKAEESDRLKSAFLANMSHEIRTPMNGVLGFSNLLSKPGLDSEEQQAYIKIIKKSGARMLNILSEIVAISKIESGAVDLQINQMNINKKMESVYELLKPDAAVKSINFSFKNNLQLTEPILITDEGKFDSILTNLVKNAIKYTDKGSIEFGYNPKEIDGSNFLEFYVKDTGIGIKQGRQDAIFERFIQADILDVEARQGAGLGLAIVKSYVEMLGGKVWVESEMGKGSIFYFTLPYVSETKEKTVGQNDLPSEKVHNQINFAISELKILIVEDDETSVIFLSTIIKNITNNVLVASSGVDAVKICQSNPDINLVLMDIQMPDMSGYEATQQIRKFNKEVIIVAQTAFAMAGDREKAIEVGCNDYISKPIEKDKLVRLIQKYFKK